MRKTIPLAKPDILEEDIAAVTEALKDSRLSLGGKLTQFEESMSAYIGTEHAIAVNSGTAALHLCVRALNIGAGDEVITTPFSFIASSNCLLYEGAIPRFVDIDSESLCIDPEKVEAAITPRTKAILAVDIFGRTADWDALETIASKHNLALIEDSCEALGTRTKGRRAGSFGNCGTLAFYPNKQLTTGEGGMITTNDARVAEAARSMRNQGRVAGVRAPIHDTLGYNYRISEINCALGTSQLKRIDDGLRKRQRIIDMYTEYLAPVADLMNLPKKPENSDVNWFTYAPVLQPELTSHRNGILENLHRHNIECTHYFYPIHLQPLYRERFGYSEGQFPIAETVGSSTLVLPLHLSLTEEDIAYICTTLTNVIHGCSFPALA